MLEEINNQISKCTRCPLYKFKTNYVPGDGNPKFKDIIYRRSTW